LLRLFEEAFSTGTGLGFHYTDLEVTELRALSALSAADANAYGTKVANLGELLGVLPAENRVSGFALPFRAYADFMAETGLDAEVESLFADQALRTDAAHKARATRGAA
jgi:phosphoenolpyruvate synthase/pyruvate phosphate dikinase